MELLAGIHEITQERFPHLRTQVGLAFALSEGRVIEEALILICNEVLQVPFPPHLTAPLSKSISSYLDIVRRATRLKQITGMHVPFKGGWAGLHTATVEELIASLKREWIDAIEQIATDTYPDWRALEQTHGRRLPAEIAKQIDLEASREAIKISMTMHFLRWLGVSTERAQVDLIKGKLDASLEFANFVVREFLMGRYSLAKHSSDVYDNFQLRYLAMDRFVVVTNDSDYTKRTTRSSQAHRINSK